MSKRNRYEGLSKDELELVRIAKKEERERIILILESRQNESVIDIVKDLKKVKEWGKWIRF